MPSRFSTIERDGWTLLSGEERHALDPDTSRSPIVRTESRCRRVMRHSSCSISRPGKLVVSSTVAWTVCG
jgi:hypothetical protein